LEEVWLEWLLCKHEALSSNPTPTKNKISSLKDNSQSKEKKKKAQTGRKYFQIAE
jgi:hypothetical protein